MNSLLLIVFLLTQIFSFPSGTSVINGQVRTTAGTPVVGIPVVAKFFPESLENVVRSPGTEAQTDEEGRFTFRYLVAGRYTIAVGAGDSPTYYPGVLLRDAASIVDVAEGATASAIDISLPRSAVGVRVSGRVRFQSSEARSLSSFNIKTSYRNSGPPIVVESDGSFELLHVPRGDFKLSLERNGMDGAKLIEKDVHVADLDISGIELVVPRFQDVPGRIVIEGGGAVPFATQFLLNSGLGTMRFAFTRGRNETFKTSLPVGDSRIEVSSPPNGYYIKSATYDSVDVFKPPIHIDGSALKEMQVTLAAVQSAPRAKVKGRVLGLSRVGGVVGPIYLSNGTWLPIAADGSFEATGLPPGTYSLSATSGKGYDITTSFVVRGQDIEGVELVVPGVATVNGRIIVEGGRQIPDFLGAEFSGIKGGALLQVHPRDDGSFTLNIPEGEGHFDIDQVKSSYRVKSLTYGSQNLLRDMMRIDASRPAEIVLTLGVDPNVIYSKVIGKVVGYAKLPPGDRKVVLSGMGLMNQTEAPVSPDGSFAFASVPSGVYTVSLMPEVAGAQTGIQVVNKDVAVQVNIP